MKKRLIFIGMCFIILLNLSLVNGATGTGKFENYSYRYGSDKGDKYVIRFTPYIPNDRKYLLHVAKYLVEKLFNENSISTYKTKFFFTQAYTDLTTNDHFTYLGFKGKKNVYVCQCAGKNSMAGKLAKADIPGEYFLFTIWIDQK